MILSSLLLPMPWGCLEPGPNQPTEADLLIIRQNLLLEIPEMKYRVGANLEGKVTYLGMDLEPEMVRPGQPFTLTHYWQVHQPVGGWNIFVHLHGPNKQGFINADHTPIGGRYPVSLWKVSEIVRDSHTTSLPQSWDLPAVEVFTGLWNGPLRMKVVGPQDEEDRIFVASLPVQTTKPPPTPRRLVAFKTAKPLKLDGILDEEVWSRTPSTGPFVDPQKGAAVVMRSEARVAWDLKFLYLAFENQDPDVWSTLKQRDDKLWTQEAVEAMVDADGDGKDYIQIQVNPLGTVSDSRLTAGRPGQPDWNGEIRVGVGVKGTLNQPIDIDRGWTVEIGIPWKDATGRGGKAPKHPPRIGDRWRANFFRTDAPSGQPPRACAWSPPLGADFHLPDRFGELVFGDDHGSLSNSPSP